MNEILDEDLTQPNPESDSTQALILKASGYILIMVVGIYLFSHYVLPNAHRTTFSIGMVFFFTVFAECIGWIRRKII